MFQYSRPFISLISCLLITSRVMASQRPNIIYIIADDLGWNDLSFHGSDQFMTPNIDTLAYNGIILNSHYVLPMCTPSRSALLTGMYPIHLGMQGFPIRAEEPRALPPGNILPQYLKKLGYRTGGFGKWHLGHYKADVTPNYRGFDSFFGYWNGFVSYYDYMLEVPPSGNRPSYDGFDLRRNMSIAYDGVGKYATDLFTDEACKFIKNHNEKQPLFMYFSHLAVHSANRGKLLEAPQDVVDRFQHIRDPNRRTYAAMVWKMDESVGRLVEALQHKNMLHNSIIVFIADNGAPTVGQYPNWGSNYPLRGAKETLWEGGVRGAAMVWSPLLSAQHTPRVSNQLMHVSDWLPTLYCAAGGSEKNLPKMDGKDMWMQLSDDLPSRRKEILLNIDEVRRTMGLRIEKWKLVVGTVENGTYDGYYGQGTNKPPETNPKYDIGEMRSSKSYRAIEYLAQKYRLKPPTKEVDIFRLRRSATIACQTPPPGFQPCSPATSRDFCLYDISQDPCELNNLSTENSQVMKKMYQRLQEYRRTLVPQINKAQEMDLANPALFNGTWSVWYDSQGVPLASKKPQPKNFKWPANKL